ncbi:MAG: TetR/AcrR family transcriptional regulator [Pseudomonadota bacterium]
MEQKITKSGRLSASETKRLAILDNALILLLNQGFEGMSMDELAERAFVAKPTIYNHFGGKEQLFAEVVEHSLKKNRDKIIAEEVLEVGAEAGLYHMAFELTSMFGRDDDMLRLCQLCIVSADRFPMAIDTFLKSGPWQGTERMADCIAHWHKAGELEASDPMLAAQQLAELCKVSIFDRRLYGQKNKMPVDTCERVAREAVRTFLARFGRSNAPLMN